MGKRSRGRPRNRWRDSVLKDIRVLVVKNWSKVVMDKSAWHDLVEKSKTHRGLQNERRSYIYIYIYIYTHTYTHTHTHVHIYSCGQPWTPLDKLLHLSCKTLLYKCLTFSFPACSRTADVFFKSTNTRTII